MMASHMKTLDHPYQNLSGGQWLRGNLHAHTTRSDGTRDMPAVIADYARRGYDFLMISDHDIYTGPEDYAGVDAHGLVLISGNEVTRGGPHLLHVDADRLIEPQRERQAVMDAVAASRGFVIVNHPNWQEGFDHCSMELLRAWRGYAGVEIYNGVIGRLKGSPYATAKWETLLAEGRRVWGFANDDSHLPADVELGWNTVYTEERSVEGIIAALRAGRFYASTGVIITDIHVADGRIRIETSNAERIGALSRWAQRFAVADANTIEVEVPDGTPYVRFECWGRGEQFAWTQPFWIVDG